MTVNGVQCLEKVTELTFRAKLYFTVILCLSSKSYVLYLRRRRPKIYTCWAKNRRTSDANISECASNRKLEIRQSTCQGCIITALKEGLRLPASSYTFDTICGQFSHFRYKMTHCIPRPGNQMIVILWKKLHIFMPDPSPSETHILGSSFNGNMT